MANIPEEDRFSKNTIILSQAIYEGITQLYNAGYKTVDPVLISYAVTVITAFNKHYLIQGFIENSHDKCWDNIRARDEVFFIANASDIFKYLPMDHVNLFKDLFLTKDKTGKLVVPNTLKEQIWKLFDAMIKISIKYVHKNRNPESYETKEGIINTYKAEFFEDVDVAKHAAAWKVQLEFPAKF